MRWTERAKRWLPDVADPLRVRVHLGSAVAFDTYHGLTALEGALQYAVVEMESGEVPSDAISALGEPYDIPIPIADVEIHGRLIARCSHAQWPEHATEDRRPRRRRTDVDVIGGRTKVATNGGPFKSLDIPVATRLAGWVDFFVVGDRVKLEGLLCRLAGLGRDFARGLGTPVGFEVTPAVDRALVHEGRPQRTIPITDPVEAGVLYDPTSYEIRQATTRAPYWLQRSRTLCVVPR